MTIEKYLNLRESFLSKYEQVQKNDFGYAYLKHFNNKDFKIFIFIFSYDYPCSFTNVVSSISPIKFIIRKGLPADKIRIEGYKSVLDKWPEQFDKIKNYYTKLTT